MSLHEVKKYIKKSEKKMVCSTSIKILPKTWFLYEIVYNVYIDVFDKTCNVETPIDLYIDIT